MVWSQHSVRLIKPSVDQCKEVISKLEDKHIHITLSDSSSESIQFLIPTLLERNTIKRLQLSFLTRDDVLSFSLQLSTNKSLTILDLSNGSISDDGVIALAQSLQCNKTLQYLHLNDNLGITSASAQSLAELLVTNNTLSRLYLDDTSIDTDGVMILIKSLNTNKTLTTLGLDKQHKESCSTFPYYGYIKNRLNFW